MFNELINAYLQNFPQEELQALQGSPNFLRLNMLLNNDVEIRGTEWEGAYFPEITELYFQLMKLLSSQSPLFNHISEQKMFSLPPPPFFFLIVLLSILEYTKSRPYW